MRKSLSYTLTETLVRKFLNEFKDSPKRSLRNIVDIALYFSEGRFQKNFFSIIQNMLKNNNSAYYTMIQNLINDIDMDRILTLGMNIGYNSCTKGAERIREIESTLGFNVPWTISIKTENDQFWTRKKYYVDLVGQGHDLGVYTWMLYADGNVSHLIEFAIDLPDDAFIIYVEPEEITGQIISEMKYVNNIMFAVEYKKGADEACCRLREAGILYSVFFVYNESDLEQIQCNTLLEKIVQLKPVFTGFLSSRNCPTSVVDQVYEYIKKTRDGQLYPTVPWDIINDNMFIDSIISADCCFACFEENGDMVSYTGGYRPLDSNLFEQSLEHIFKKSFPKEIKSTVD